MLTSAPPPTVDVVIVGGGIGGLATARLLSEADVSCVVLERRDRIGGRLLTHSSGAGSFDLGATWFWPGEYRVAAMIAELGVPTHPHYLAGDAMYHAPGGAQRIDRNPIDVVSGRFTLGAASLAERLAERLDGIVYLGVSVEAVHSHGDTVEVHHNLGTTIAHHVVLAAPPSVVVHDIDFEPRLPDGLQALASATPVWMASVVKAVVVYPEAFWRRQGLSGSVISHIGPLREIHDMSGIDGMPAALFGFAPMEPGTSSPSTEEIVTQLVDIFGPEAAHPIEVVTEDWRREVETLPSSAVTLSPMQTYGHPAYQEPTGGGHIHWASTETSTSSPGHIEGAIAAAERAAHAILSDLLNRPSADRPADER